MSSGEIINVLNESGEVIGTTTPEEAERGGHTTDNVLVFVFTSLGKLWTQLRPETKRTFRGLWDISACGAVRTGEEHGQAAHREAAEEMLISVELFYVESFINVLETANGQERRHRSHVYVGISDEQPQPNEEVAAFKEWNPDELRAHALARPEVYVPSFVVELDKGVRGYQLLIDGSLT